MNILVRKQSCYGHISVFNILTIVQKNTLRRASFPTETIDLHNTVLGITCSIPQRFYRKHLSCCSNNVS